MEVWILEFFFEISLRERERERERMRMSHVTTKTMYTYVFFILFSIINLTSGEGEEWTYLIKSAKRKGMKTTTYVYFNPHSYSHLFNKN
jgi:hypothetical protein